MQSKVWLFSRQSGRLQRSADGYLLCYWGDGNLADSPEHLFSKWMNRRITLLRDLFPNHRMNLDGIHLQAIGSDHLAVTGVCEDCNKHWMSRVEKPVAGNLERMIQGELTVLDQKSQLSIARWAVLKSLVLDGDPGRCWAGLTSLASRKGFRNEGLMQMPPNTLVTCMAVDTPTFGVDCNYFFDGDCVAGFRVIMFLGFVSLRVMFRIQRPGDSELHVQAGGGILNGVATLWPPQDTGLSWPPDRVHTHQEAVAAHLLDGDVLDEQLSRWELGDNFCHTCDAVHPYPVFDLPVPSSGLVTVRFGDRVEQISRPGN